MRELIRRRVFQEVAEYKARTPEVFQGLVQPQDTERVLNGYAVCTRRRIDPEAQTEQALKAFAGNGFPVLVGDRQAEEATFLSVSDQFMGESGADLPYDHGQTRQRGRGTDSP
ncbi:hypothetical protein [Streptomyces sp. NPDC057301]|uniref:hypothetical protein n=1 Tax=Streptomyces sp. NPDC057301 TaxID=3346093 RepID=UPI00362A7C77